MMKRIDANSWEVVDHKEGGWDLDLKGRSCLLDLEVVGTEEVLLSGIDLQGEVKGLQRGPMIHVRAHMNGFRGLNLSCAGSMSIRCAMSDGAEFVDPVPLTVTEARPVDPVRAAMGEQLRALLAAQEANRRLSDEEIEELVEDFVNPELEFEEDGDNWGLPAAAAELEQQAAEAREKAQEEFNRRREEELDQADVLSGGPDTPPGEQSKPKAPAQTPIEDAISRAAKPAVTA